MTGHDDLKIVPVSYRNPEHLILLAAVLKKWFRDPKDLNFTDPRMRYPFSFQRWKKTSYEIDNSETYVVKKADWIIGYASIQSRDKDRRYHIFHFFIDKEYRSKGIGTWFLQKLLAIIDERKPESVTLKVSPMNANAINLYESCGFQVDGMTANGSMAMVRFPGEKIG